MPFLFSYGTLQQEAVQLSTFGRRLEGHADELVGFEQGLFTIEDPEFVAKSGKADHAIVKFNGRDDSRVRGMVFEVTDAELAQADQYEPAGYKRVSARLASGKQAWVYADTRVDRVNLRAFAGRDWAAAERGKHRYWAEQYWREGSTPAWRASALLLEHARRIGAGVIDEAHRAEDLAHHVAVRDRLDRAARAFIRR